MCDIHYTRWRIFIKNGQTLHFSNLQIFFNDDDGKDDDENDDVDDDDGVESLRRRWKAPLQTSS